MYVFDRTKALALKTSAVLNGSSIELTLHLAAAQRFATFTSQQIGVSPAARAEYFSTLEVSFRL